MKLEELEAFTAFVKLQSTSQAALQLGITQPALSRRIQSLEQTIDLKLFDRNTRPLKLTTIGLQVYEQSKKILEETQNLKNIIANHKIEAMQLNIGIANSITEVGLAKILKALDEIYPNIHITIHAAWGKDLVQKLQNKELDGIISLIGLTQKLPQDFEIQVLKKLKVLPVIAKKYIKQNIKFKQDFQNLGWILNTDGCGLRAKLFDIFAEDQQTPNINFEVLGTALQLELIAQGLGIGLIPEDILSISQRNHEVYPINNSEIEFDIQLYTAYSKKIKIEKKQVILQMGYLFKKQLINDNN